MNNKREKFYVIYAVLYFMSLLIFGILAKKEKVGQDAFETGKLLFVLFLLVPFIIWAVVSVKDYFSSTIKSSRSCGDPLFDELDCYYKKHLTESKEHYQMLINAIKYYYKQGGKIDRVIGSDLKRLYNRLYFLKRALKSNEYLFTCFSSIGLSVCATLVWEYILADDKTQIFFIFILLGLWMAILLLHYDKSFRNENEPIYEYELKILEEKIALAEENILIDYQSEDMMLTKQHILDELVRKSGKAFGKMKSDIINDIKIVEKINLTVSNESKYEKLIFFVGKKRKQCVLFLTADNKFATEQHKALYMILRKYNMIYEWNEDR